MFQVTLEEMALLKLQIGTSKGEVKVVQRGG